MRSPCLELDPQDYVAESALAFALRGELPVSEGHSLVIAPPRRLTPTRFEAPVHATGCCLRLVG